MSQRDRERVLHTYRDPKCCASVCVRESKLESAPILRRSNHVTKAASIFGETGSVRLQSSSQVGRTTSLKKGVILNKKLTKEKRGEWTNELLVRYQRHRSQKTRGLTLTITDNLIERGDRFNSSSNRLIEAADSSSNRLIEAADSSSNRQIESEDRSSNINNSFTI